MTKMTFMQKLEAKWDEGKFVCVGLDSELEKVLKATGGNRMNIAYHLFTFNTEIVNATADLVCAYKPNIAFYEAHGEDGLRALRRTIQHIKQVAPEVPVILDAKRGDIGKTNEAYAKMAFDWLGADAITVHPYLGQESLRPFLERKDKGVIVLCKTSNVLSNEFQDISVGGVPLYKMVAESVANRWNGNGNCALVAGATYPKELAEIRKIAGDMPILIPGIGAQGGDLEKTVLAGMDSRGRGMIINSSSGIIFASSGRDFAEAARRETLKLHEAIQAVLSKAVMA